MPIRRSALSHEPEKKAFTIAQKQWLASHFQPKGCNALFTLWMQQKRTPGHLAWVRYVKAVRARQDKLANYIQKQYFNQTYQEYAVLFQQVFQYPPPLKHWL